MKINPTRKILLSIMLVWMHSGCNENTIDPVFFGVIHGTVIFKSSGEPASGVEVATLPATTTLLTDSLGNFSITDVPTGDYSVVAQFEGYAKTSNKIVVTKNNTTTTQLELVADDSAPNPPTVAFPSNGANNVNRSISLKWQVEKKNDGILKYNVRLFESNDQTPLIDLKDFADTLLEVQNLKFNTTYFWQVNVTNGVGIITNGELWQFKTAPFPDNRFLFTSQRDGNYEIYSSDESGEALVRLTYSDQDQVYPRYSNDRSLIAYTQNVDLAYQIFIMHQDGSAPAKVTSLPVAGFHNDGKGFCWSPDNGKLLYSSYDKLYTIDRNGSNLVLIATAPAGRNFGACDWSGVTNMIVVETVGTLPYEAEIHLIDPVNNSDDIIISDAPGCTQSPSFSVDGNFVLYTHDISGFESSTGRQLDSHLFRYEIATSTSVDLSHDKKSGTNDLNPRYSPDGAKIIFENRSNDGSAQPAVYTYNVSEDERVKLFDNAGMPQWR